MAEPPAGVDQHTAQLAALKKLVAAKDAQISALASKAELLADDVDELKAERAYLTSTCEKLEQARSARCAPASRIRPSLRARAAC